MNISESFIKRPVATTLITIGIALAGAISFNLLPVSPLPQVDFPTISVQAQLPGASPEDMATSVATPLERSLGRISGITEITSSSSLGSTRITLQFDLNRDIDGAARDVQAAINGARNLLPTGLPGNPTYRKVNPADAPIMILALTSDTMNQGDMYDAASTILAQKLSQLHGVGQVSVGGSALPAVRVDLNPDALNKYGVGLEAVRTMISGTNANRPKGSLESEEHHWQIYANDQARRAAEYLPLIVAYHNGATVRLSDIGTVTDSVQDIRNSGMANGRPAVLVIINRQPGANIIETVDLVKKMLPNLRASIPAAIHVQVAMDRTPTIRASLRDVERSLLISTGLVILVVFLFLRNTRAALIPTVAVPVSLIGTFAVMHLAGFSLNNLSLMALTIATGFVVDDAIVVLENISRHLEAGMSPIKAAVRGTREVVFTVVSMSLSLIGVFIPILLMGGIIGRLFREFAVTLSAAILISMLISLTTTPMMCARLLKQEESGSQGVVGKVSNQLFNWSLDLYKRTLSWALDHKRFILMLWTATVCLNIYLYVVIPKGFFPQQDTGRLMGNIQADQAISFQAMKQKLADFMNIIRKDPAVEQVVGFTGGGQRNTGMMFITLKPQSERNLSVDRVIARLRGKLSQEAGANLFLQAVQDIRMGGRQSNSQYQYTLQGDDLKVLTDWEPRIRQVLSKLPVLADVNTDQQNKGLETLVMIDRDTASRLGISESLIDTTLNDAFGQRLVSTIYEPLNQYRVVMEAAPQYLQSPDSLSNFYVTTGTGSGIREIPFSAFSHYRPSNAPLAVNHQGQFAASTISFNLPPGVSLSQASGAINNAMKNMTELPGSIYGSFQGTAKAFQDSLKSQPWLILAALVTVYIVLGILYESYIHPVTILSTLPSAGVGALLALLLCKIEFSVIALIGIFLLIGIVKKNAIMMIDFALETERKEGLKPDQAIFQACLLRFRPIMMTTVAAFFGAIPLAIGFGEGAEIRQPLGISVVGGLVISQLLTLYTTPVIYLYLDRLRFGRKDRWHSNL
jgi:multidrug efflux pump